MDILWIDVAVGVFAGLGVRSGLKKGGGEEMVRLAKRLLPGVFGIGGYAMIAGPLKKLIGLESGASGFWAFVILVLVAFVLMKKLKENVFAGLKAIGAGLPKGVAGALGGVRSLSTSTLVLFPAAMVPWDNVRGIFADHSWLVGFLHEIL